MKKVSKDFKSHELLLNYANRRWGLTKTSRVGEVMALIRECQPSTFAEWKEWYFKHAYTKAKYPEKVSRESLQELGNRLYQKLKDTVIPQVLDSVSRLTEADCVEYIYELTICRTYDGYVTEKSVIYNELARKFHEVTFEETDPELDHAGDVDYLGKVGEKAFGIQVKPITANASLGNYSVTARMQSSFRAFEEDFGGKVFIIFSVDDHIKNVEILDDIQNEIHRLQSQ